MDRLNYRYKVLKQSARRSIKPQSVLGKGKLRRNKAWQLSEDLLISFRRWLELALCEWRHDLVNPTKSLRTCYDLATAAVSVLGPHLDSDNEFPPFPFADATWIGILLTGQIEESFTELIQAFGSWRESPLATSYFDIGHFQALQTGTYPSEWDDFVTAFSKEADSELFVQTNRCYKAIIQGLSGQAPETIPTGLQLASKLYFLRKEDELYTTLSPYYGGGYENDYCVDFRLAAIVEHCFSDHQQMPKDIPQDHLWRYSP